MGHSAAVHLQHYGRLIDERRLIAEGMDAYERVHGKSNLPLQEQALHQQHLYESNNGLGKAGALQEFQLSCLRLPTSH